MTKLKKSAISVLSFISAACIASGAVVYAFKDKTANVGYASDISKLNGSVDTGIENYFDSDSVYRLPETIASEDEISVIVAMNTPSVMDAYLETDRSLEPEDYVTSRAARTVAENVADQRRKLLQILDKAKIDYVLGERYDTVLSGFEITLKAKDFEKVDGLLSDSATLIIGETYASCETEVVTNDVDVYETGIFDSSSSEYQGDGVVVAVLDTGLDYTHTAFSLDNFTTSNEKFTLSTVAEDISRTSASSFTSNLTAEDVYINKKIPYAYDYADKDTDVFPINSEHGTHVAGIIAGNDDVITGVAPNAQLAIMKVFSDVSEGAKTSWLIAALEDCVVLGVDVINMSLGSGCGFAREVDKENVNAVYDRVYEAGISLVCSAANAYNATFGSTKNGSNGLTSNPDSGTVGSPSTYKAALSVASVDGVKTPYMLHDGDIIYFTEASTSSAKTKDFVDDILATVGEDVTSYDFEYVTIPGVGRSSDYLDSDYTGKIVLVKRGTTTFEDKVRVALQEKGAAGIIIYNNVSGTISMLVGKDMGAVCSISQDEGEKLAEAKTGIITVSKEQVAGPFMSDFSSWGPTSDLQIKPEITAHGGEILSSVPGQSYDRLSGTSMAAPNQSGATALVRQYVTYSGVFGNSLTPVEITARVNQLMMSTADIVYNKNGLPYAVRKQGAGLVNIAEATSATSYITTYDSDGAAMDKTKLELGDDKNKTGVYEMTFDVNNVGGTSVTYDIGSIVMTEGVSTTYTSHGDTTVTQDGRLLDAATSVTSVSGGQQNGNSVTVGAHGTAKVTVRITLSDSDKKYLDQSFAYGMYVEGFITLTAQGGTTVDLNVPLLAFYGDWTEAPIFDEEYYDTNKDEINAGLDDEDKLMADAFATRVIGGLYSDYIATLGTYYFVQDPSATQIAASKEHIAISNQQNDASSAINSIRSVTAGLLRNAKEVDIVITEDATGLTVFERTEYNQQKSYSSGSTIYGSSIDVEFGALEYALKNNTRYTVTLTSYIDYGEKEEQNNVRNTFVFPLYIDFEAPIVTDVVYRTEYDRTTKKTKLYADLSIYDNHYAMGVQFGQITPADPSSGYTFALSSFGKYITPVYSTFNSTSTVTIELTDYIAMLKQSAGIQYDDNGTVTVLNNNNSFVATVYDYALNSATYEIRLPDEIISMMFSQEEIRLSPNETKDISSVLSIYPVDSWIEVLDFTSDNPDVADVINQTVIAKTSGTAVITAIGRNANGETVSASVGVRVLSEGDEGYVGGYSVPEVNKFTITGYYVNKAYYSVSSSEREIGITGGNYNFGGVYTLSMYPSESVTLQYTLDSYFPDRAGVTYTVGNQKVATVSSDGTIVAQAEGTTIVSVNVTFDGKSTIYSGRVSITVKDPFTTMSIYLTSYKGLGGTVEIPDDRGITTIMSYAFSNYEYVEKDLENGDVIDDEDPYYIKQMYLGENTITKVVIPEGVEEIQSYAFARLTALEEVVLPASLKRIGQGAFYGCENLEKINLENVQFINEEAFSGCKLTEADFSSVVAIGNYSFENCKLSHIVLPASSQSLGIGAFYGNLSLTSVEFKAAKIKIGSYAFAGCTQLLSVNVNASVISSYAFAGCTELYDVKLGKDVAVIGELAFYDTKVASFSLDSKNDYLTLQQDGALVFNADGSELVLVAPAFVTTTLTVTSDTIANGAFAGNENIVYVYGNNVVSVGAYAFAGCTNLVAAYLPNLEEIGDYAFRGTAITETPDLSKVKIIGDGAFAYTAVSSVAIADGASVGNFAFAYCTSLESVTIGNNVTVGALAFYSPVKFNYTYENTENTASFNYYTAYSYESVGEDGSPETYNYYRYNVVQMATSALTTLTVGENVTIGAYAFADNAKLSSLTLGEGARIDAYAFYNCYSLTSVDLSKASLVGICAFSGTTTRDYWYTPNGWSYAYEFEYLDGELTAVAYVYSSAAPSITSVDLTSAEEIGMGAFMNNRSLATVSLGDSITEIPAYMLANCSSLVTLALPERVDSVGENAFYGSGIRQIDLKNVYLLQAYCFANTALESVTVAQSAVIGEGAFYDCYSLAEVGNLDQAVSIGDYALYATALQKVDLSSAVEVGSFAFAASAVTEVNFGGDLRYLGENPFFGCEIATFGKEQKLLFGGAEIGTETVETYAVSETVKVIDGVLYGVVPNGLVLISFPMAKEQSVYAVEEGTVRISDCAFAGTALKTVTLPTTLLSVGDKAFYGCEQLSMVIFTGYDAPMLEEKYVSSYVNLENLPYTGRYATEYNGEVYLFEGLGISKYYMWNITTNPSNFYFGANFVDYIGHIDGDLIMVYPANGQGYDTFVFSQYFGTVVYGNNAATAETKNVIAMIDALPAATEITLSSEAAIVAARAAYDELTSVEQQALVTNLSKLSVAESTLAYLKNQSVTPAEPEEPVAETNGALLFFRQNFYIGYVIAGVAILALVAYIVVVRLKKNAVKEKQPKEKEPKE